MNKTLLTILGSVAVVFSAAAQATGSAENPLTVDQFIAQGAPQSPVANTFVKGYIVGYVTGKSWVEAEVSFEAPTDPSAQKTNIVLASSSGEDDLTYCIPVQLPVGSCRDALNLVDHPENLGKQVTLCGSHEKYFGVNGLKSVSSYAWDGQEIEVLPAVVSTLNETFESIPSNWTKTGNPAFYTTTFQGNSYAAVTGYKNNPPFDSWLITPGLEVKADAKDFSFRTQVNGYGSTTTSFEIYLMDNVDPDKADLLEKIECPLAVAPESGYSSWVESGVIDLYKLAGNKAGTYYVAFNYVASEDANYATWCVDDVKFNSNGTTTPVNPGNHGTIENPLSVADLLALPKPSAEEKGYVVKGIIVGFVADKNISSAVFGTAENASNTNILLADSKDVANTALVLPVQLPQGSVRDGLSLLANPDNLFKTVTLVGDFAAYFGQNGLKNTSAFYFEGEAPKKAVFSSLSDNADGWTVEYAEALPDEMTYVWKWDDQYKNYKASSYVDGTDYPADATAISPVIDLTGYKDLSLSFSHAGKFFTDLTAAAEECQVLVREENDNWNALTVNNWFNNTSWTFVSDTIDLEAFADKKIQLGLRYVATAKAGTWEVKNLVINGTNDSAVKTLNANKVAVRVIDGTIIAPADAEVYTLSGLRSGRENLQKGIYLVRTADQVVKVLVK